MDDLRILSFPELTLAVGQWSKRNFGDKQDAYTGMVEELGELARCMLKRHQGIRGYDSPVFFRTNYIDALGDISIYSANFAYNNSLKVEWPSLGGKFGYGTPRKNLGSACYWLSKLILTPETKEDLESALHSFLITIAWLSYEEGLYLHEVANETWQVVSVRDWKANKESGDVKAS